MNTFETEIKQGQRFEFGKNWKAFLTTLTDERISIAESSIKTMLEVDNLNGKTFLDIGSGSGLSSLAARRLGATVHSFDYDPSSVACTQELRSRYLPDDPNWVIEEGSALDTDYLSSLGEFDVVYSWGVLHHTGDMWSALENVHPLVKNNGILFLALYNDEGKKSDRWRKIKKFYCSGFAGKSIVSCVFIPYFFCKTLFKCITKKMNIFRQYKNNRGMSITHDWYDWLGGFPFQVSSTEKIFLFFRNRGFILKNLRSTNGLGNNEFAFLKSSNQ